MNTAEDADTPVIVDETPKVYGPSPMHEAYAEYIADLRRELVRAVTVHVNELVAHFCKLNRIPVVQPEDAPK